MDQLQLPHQQGEERQPCPIFYINLDSNLQRRQNMEKQLAQQGLVAKRFSAIDEIKIREAKLTKHVAPQVLLDLPKRIRSKHCQHSGYGSIGCYLSHVHIWKLLQDEKEDFALVLEDDVEFDYAFKDRLIYLLAQAPPWDYLCLCQCIDVGTPTDMYSTTDQQFQFFKANFMGTAGYLIKKEFAARLLQTWEPITVQIDAWLNQFLNETNMWIVNPFLISLSPDAYRSDIQHTPVYGSYSPTIYQSRTSFTSSPFIYFLGLIVICLLFFILAVNFRQEQKN